MWRATIVTEPTDEPINEREVKEHCRIEVGETGEDEFIRSLIVTARKYVEQITGRAILDQTWDLYLDDWPEGDVIVIPKPPLIWTVADSYVKYTDSDDTTHTFYNVGPPVTYDYDVDTDSEPGRIVLKYGESWPCATLRPMNPINIRFDCGWTEPANVPDGIKSAMKLLIADMYEIREPKIIGATVQTLDTVDILLASYRLWDWNV